MSCPHPEKHRHVSKGAAMAHIAAMDRTKEVDLLLKPYPCHGHWHIGHSSPGSLKVQIKRALRSGSKAVQGGTSKEEAMTGFTSHAFYDQDNDDSFLLYHWSPTSRRKAINRRGFVPGSLSTDRLWRPPFSCWSTSPSLAWALSGMTPRGREVPSWDLWCVWSDRLDGWEVIPFDDGRTADRPKEYRVYHRIFKRDIWYVATRVTGDPA